jgi:hypothetical protein
LHKKEEKKLKKMKIEFWKGEGKEEL